MVGRRAHGRHHVYLKRDEPASALEDAGDGAAAATGKRKRPSQGGEAGKSGAGGAQAKGSARARLLNERRELLMKKGDGDTLQRRGKETKKKASVRRSLLARTGKSPLKRSQSSALRTMR